MALKRTETQSAEAGHSTEPTSPPVTTTEPRTSPAADPAFEAQFAFVLSKLAVLVCVGVPGLAVYWLFPDFAQRVLDAVAFGDGKLFLLEATLLVYGALHLRKWLVERGNSPQ